MSSNVFHWDRLLQDLSNLASVCKLKIIQGAVSLQSFTDACKELYL